MFHEFNDSCRIINLFKKCDMSTASCEMLEGDCVKIGVSVKLHECNAEGSRQTQEINIVRNTDVSMCLHFVMADLIYLFEMGHFLKI